MSYHFWSLLKRGPRTIAFRDPYSKHFLPSSIGGAAVFLSGILSSPPTKRFTKRHCFSGVFLLLSLCRVVSCPHLCCHLHVRLEARSMAERLARHLQTCVAFFRPLPSVSALRRASASEAFWERKISKGGFCRLSLLSFFGTVFVFGNHLVSLHLHPNHRPLRLAPHWRVWSGGL